PTILPVIAALVPRHAAVTTRSHFSALASDIVNAAAQTVLLVAFLPHQAWLMLDAIGRTMYRLFVSRRRRLDDWPSFAAQMVGSLLITSLAAVAVWQAGRAALPVAAPVILAWLLSPAI